MPEQNLPPRPYEELWFDRQGLYAPKNARYLRISGTDNPDIMLVEFQVPLKKAPGLATMAVPLSMSDAANLLANLLEAQQRGRLPAFATPQKPTDVN